MGRRILVCTRCKVAIFLDSSANLAPRWKGEVGDPPEKREEIRGQDDLRDFQKAHGLHELIKVKLND